MTADIFAAARRRWWVVLVGLLLTGGLVYSAQHVVRPSYEATASVLLLPSKTTITGTTNPYLLLGGVNNARDALVVRLGASAGDNYPPDGPVAVKVTSDPNSPAPLVDFSALASTQQQAKDVLDKILATVGPMLDDLQVAAQVPREQYIASIVIAKPSRLTVVSQSSKRAMVVAGVAGVAFTLVSLALLDRLLLARQRRSAARPEAAAEGDADLPPEE